MSESRQGRDIERLVERCLAREPEHFGPLADAANALGSTLFHDGGATGKELRCVERAVWRSLLAITASDRSALNPQLTAGLEFLEQYRFMRAYRDKLTPPGLSVISAIINAVRRSRRKLLLDRGCQTDMTTVAECDLLRRSPRYTVVPFLLVDDDSAFVTELIAVPLDEMNGTLDAVRQTTSFRPANSGRVFVGGSTPRHFSPPRVAGKEYWLVLFVDMPSVVNREMEFEDRSFEFALHLAMLFAREGWRWPDDWAATGSFRDDETSDSVDPKRVRNKAEAAAREGYRLLAAIPPTEENVFADLIQTGRLVALSTWSTATEWCRSNIASRKDNWFRAKTQGKAFGPSVTSVRRHTTPRYRFVVVLSFILPTALMLSIVALVTSHSASDNESPGVAASTKWVPQTAREPHASRVRVLLHLTPYDSGTDGKVATDVLKGMLLSRVAELHEADRESGPTSTITIPDVEVSTPQAVETSFSMDDAMQPDTLLAISSRAELRTAPGDGRKVYTLRDIRFRINPALIVPDSHHKVSHYLYHPFFVGCRHDTSILLCERLFPHLNVITGESRGHRFRHFAKGLADVPESVVLDYSQRGEFGTFGSTSSIDMWSGSAPEGSFLDIEHALAMLLAVRLQLARMFATDGTVDALPLDLVYAVLDGPASARAQFLPIATSPKDIDRADSPITSRTRMLTALTQAELAEVAVTELVRDDRDVSERPELATLVRQLEAPDVVLNGLRRLVTNSCPDDVSATECILSSAALEHTMGSPLAALTQLVQASYSVTGRRRAELLHFSVLYAEMLESQNLATSTRAAELRDELRAAGAWAVADFEQGRHELFSEGNVMAARDSFERVLSQRPNHLLTRFLVAVLDVPLHYKGSMSNLGAIMEDSFGVLEFDDELHSLGFGDGVEYSVDANDVFTTVAVFLASHCEHRALSHFLTQASSIKAFDATHLARRLNLVRPSSLQMFPFRGGWVLDRSVPLGPATCAGGIDAQRALDATTADR